MVARAATWPQHVTAPVNRRSVNRRRSQRVATCGPVAHRSGSSCPSDEGRTVENALRDGQSNGSPITGPLGVIKRHHGPRAGGAPTADRSNSTDLRSAPAAPTDDGCASSKSAVATASTIRGGVLVDRRHRRAAASQILEPVASLILAELRTAVATAGGVHPDVEVARCWTRGCARTRSGATANSGLTLPGTTRAVAGGVAARCAVGRFELDEIAGRTPGFVVADLQALVREAAALQAASRRCVRGGDPEIPASGSVGALSVIRPLASVGHRGSNCGSDVGRRRRWSPLPLTRSRAVAATNIRTRSSAWRRLRRGVLCCTGRRAGRDLRGAGHWRPSGRLSVHAVKGAQS